MDYIQHFSYGARGFMRVPVSEANDLNFFVVGTTQLDGNAASVANGIWMFQHGRELKEETTFDHDGIAVLIDHEGTTSVVAVRFGLETPGWSAGAGSGGYGPETCYNRALMLAAQMMPTIEAAVHR